jgi:hypothetical protein
MSDAPDDTHPQSFPNVVAALREASFQRAMRQHEETGRKMVALYASIWQWLIGGAIVGGAVVAHDRPEFGWPIMAAMGLFGLWSLNSKVSALLSTGPIVVRPETDQ